MPAGQFRHGPLEMCGPDLTVILFAGEQVTRDLNQRLAAALKSCGARVYWVGSEIEHIPTLPMPLVVGLGRPLAEMLPIQLLTILLAEQAGVVPGKFRHIGKVTLLE
jgi:glucosamine--fructose-6-phosphate aminotransferase (isomerizing)